MKKIVLVAIVFLFSGVKSFAQNVFAGHDTTICQGSTITLHASLDSAGLITQFFNIADDVFSPVVNIGFPFKYFGNTYTQCILSTNDEITFDLGEADQFSTWIPNGDLPNTNVPTIQNSILGPFQDVLPGAGGIMSYATFGSAPNRYFVFNFCSSPMYQCTNINFTGQTIIYEGTNIIETHITDKVTCAGWNTGQAIHGIQNADGTVAYIVPGRNANTQWVTSNEGMRWTPDTTTWIYAIDPIPFAPVPMLGNLEWTSITGAQLGTLQDLTVTPTQTTSYILNMTDCGTGSDTVTIYVSQFDTTTFYHNPACPNSFDGFIGVNCTGTGPYNIVWKDAQGNIIQSNISANGIDTLLNIGPGTYQLIVSDSIGCVKNHFYTLSTVTYNASYFYPGVLCKGETFDFTNTSTGNPVSYSWNFGDGGVSTQFEPSHTFATDGDYTVQLIVTYNGGCTDTATHILTVHPLIETDFGWLPDNICEVDLVQFFDNSNQYPVSWIWSFGDGSVGTGSAPAHQYQNGSYTVKLVSIDSLCGIDSAEKNITIYYQPYPNIGPDTGLCEGEAIILDSGYPDAMHHWSNGDQTEITTIHAAASQYYTVAVDNHGCVGYDTILVFLKCNVDIPSAFSPNGDGINDIFRPRGNKIASYSMQLFNRWGVEIFDNAFNSIEDGWNGRFEGVDCEIGVYIYHIQITYVNGVSDEFYGNLTLLR